MRKARENKHGYVMLLAVVIIAVLLMLSLLLLTVSYSLYHTSAKQHDNVEVRELAYSLSEQIGEELVDTTFETQSEEDDARAAGNHALWFLLRNNINTNAVNPPWPYHNEEEWRHKAENSYKYFTLNEIDNPDVDADDVQIRMSWESDQETVKNDGIHDVRMNNDGGFEVEVKVTVGNESCTVLSKYDLHMGTEYDGQWIWSLVDRQ